MMKTIELVISGTDSPKKTYLPFKDPSRLVGARVVCGTAQTGAATVAIKAAGADKDMFKIDLYTAQAGNYDAGTVYEMPVPTEGDAPSQKQQKEILDLDTPLEIDVDLDAAANVTLVLVTDPFLIGAHEGLDS